MLDQLLENVKSHIGEKLQGENLPDGFDIHSFAQTAGNGIFDSLKNNAGAGNLNGLMEMFSGQDTQENSPAVGSMMPDIVNKLSEKFGLDSNQVQGMVSKFLPSVMNMFNSKVNSGSFDINSIISQFKGENVGDMVENIKGNTGGGILDTLKGFFGK